MIEPWSKNFYQHFGARVMVDAFHTYEADGYFEQTMYMGDHTGTHVESSKHFSKNGVTIGETPLADYYGKAAVLNFTNKKGRGRYHVRRNKRGGKQSRRRSWKDRNSANSHGYIEALGYSRISFQR